MTQTHALSVFPSLYGNQTNALIHIMTPIMQNGSPVIITFSGIHLNTAFIMSKVNSEKVSPNLFD